MPELIDRQAALEKMCGDCKSGYDGHCPNPFGMCNEYESILQVPAIEAKPMRRGRWEYRHADDWMFCTACGADAEGNYGEPLETDYCPHCGADMREGGADNG